MPTPITACTINHNHSQTSSDDSFYEVMASATEVMNNKTSTTRESKTNAISATNTTIMPTDSIDVLILQLGQQ